MVAPLAGATIIVFTRYRICNPILSLPSRERGLKSSASVAEVTGLRRSPRGSVD